MMAAQVHIQCVKSVAIPASEARLSLRDAHLPPFRVHFGGNDRNVCRNLRVLSSSGSGSGSGDKKGVSRNVSPNSKKKGGGVSASSSSNYVVPMEKSNTITRPLNEILRDLNKRIPDNIIKTSRDHVGPDSTILPWYHANRMLSFYAPGWCGEIRDVIFSDNGTVTVVYRVTIRGSDDEAFRESTGTVSSADGRTTDPVAAAEEIAFCRACARFGLGLYLYHEE